MIEKLQYATMLEIPVSTCNVTEVPTKKRRARRKQKPSPEAVKEQLLNKINENALKNDDAIEGQALEDLDTQLTKTEEQLACEQGGQDAQMEKDALLSGEENTASVYPLKKQKKKFRFSVVGVQLCIIGVLIATIFFTNAFVAESGINVFFKNVFGTEKTTQVDERTFEDFAPVIAMGGNQGVAMENGVISCEGKGSVYAPCDGVVSGLSKDESGKFIIEVSHSSNFKTILSGVEIAYVGIDDLVYGNIPVGYQNGGALSMCFTGADGSLITDYQIENGVVIWAV